FWVLLSWLAALRLTASPLSSSRWALLLGVSVGVAAAIRPVDALVMSAPVLVWCAWSLRMRPNRVATFSAFVAGCAGPVALLLWYNAATTGSPLTFGYDLMWGETHSLGFHDSPWGVSHTPVRGLELLNLYVLRLQSYLFESPAPSLLGTIAVLAVGRRALHGWMLTALALLLLAYFTYWHDGFYLGPRFVFVAVPVLALLTAQAPRALGEFLGSDKVRRGAFCTIAVAVVLGVVLGGPDRASYYARSLPTARHELTRVADSLGVRDAIIFVRESWGSQVLARMWGRRIDRPAAELLYRSVDTCVLDSALALLEREQLVNEAATARLLPLLRDSAFVRPTTLSPDRSERVRIGSTYRPSCLAQVRADHYGIALYPLVLAQERGSNIYARDLGARNTLVLREYTGREAYLLIPRALDSDQYELHRWPVAR
ncbi:MAG: hypothetical protein AB1762_06915, partial [Gemmatimonadota bacterium]